jgi:hypothetical protein
MQEALIVWWIFVFFMIVIALVALGFALVAFADAQSNQSHRNIFRRDGHFSGDVIIDSELRVEGVAVFDDNVYVNGPILQSQKNVTNGLQFNHVNVINNTGLFSIDPNIAQHRVDTSGAQTITLVLPKVNTCPGSTFWIAVSQAGQANTVNLDVSSGDMLCSGFSPCTILNPAYTMPINAGTPDQVMLTNDSVNVWFVTAHGF